MPRRTYFHYKALRNPVLFVGLFYVYMVKAACASLGAVSFLLNNKKS